MRRHRERKQIQGAGWRRLDNTGKLFAMVTGEDLSNVFRVSAVLDREISPEGLQRALMRTLPEFEVFRVRLRRGFFWYYFETNTREPSVEQETAFLCKYIEPQGNQMYPFRVSYFGTRINFEVFHALTDGMGAMNFLKRLVEIYLEEDVPGEKPGAGPEQSRTAECPRSISRDEMCTVKEKARGRASDSYLLHYRKREHRGYGGRSAFQLRGKWLPLGQTAVYHGYVDLNRFKTLCRHEGVSMTKYLAALLLWSVIQVYLEGRTKREPVAVNLPINLRAFFESDTLANFFAVTNISFPEERQPENFNEVLSEVTRQMDEKIVRERLEETISYNVSREKKCYVRITPLALKTRITRLIFLRNTRAYTLTLSNLGAVEMKEGLRDSIRDFHVIIGVSKKQPVKCGVAAFGDKVDITFSSASQDRRLQDYFYGWLDEQGVLTGREENGVVASPYARGNYPEAAAETGRIRKMMPWFYGTLFIIAAVTGIANAATYRWLGRWWSVITIAGIAYAAMTVRFSLLRNSNLAGKIFRQSLGAIAVLVLIDWNLGYEGWAFNYAVPSLLLFDVAAVGGLMTVNRLNWQSYFMYQIVITIFCLIPLALWGAGLVTRPFLSLLTAGAALILLCTTVLAGSRSVLRELRRRFHL